MTVSSCIPRFDSLPLELSAQRPYLNRIACLVSFSHALVFLLISTILSSFIALLASQVPCYLLYLQISFQQAHPFVSSVAYPSQKAVMSSRRSRSRQSSRITEDQIIDLVSKLQAVLPEARSQMSDRVSAARVLQDTCNYIRSLHQEVDDLSERLSQLLATTDGAQAAIIRSLLMQ